MEPEAFVAEGKLEVGPKKEFFAFLDGEFLGKLLMEHFDAPEVPGYADLGRVRITVERIEDAP